MLVDDHYHQKERTGCGWNIDTAKHSFCNAHAYALPNDSKHNEESLSTISTDSLRLPKLICANPCCACAHGVTMALHSVFQQKWSWQQKKKKNLIIISQCPEIYLTLCIIVENTKYDKTSKICCNFPLLLTLDSSLFPSWSKLSPFVTITGARHVRELISLSWIGSVKKEKYKNKNKIIVNNNNYY